MDTRTSMQVTGTQPVALSPVPCAALTGGDVPRALSVQEIRAVVERLPE